MTEGYPQSEEELREFIADNHDEIAPHVASGQASREDKEGFVTIADALGEAYERIDDPQI